MTVETSGTQRQRHRLALMWLVAGVLLLLWAWGWWLHRTSQSDRNERAVLPATRRFQLATDRKRPRPTPSDHAWSTPQVHKDSRKLGDPNS